MIILIRRVLLMVILISGVLLMIILVRKVLLMIPDVHRPTYERSRDLKPFKTTCSGVQLSYNSVTGARHHA